MPLRFFVQDIKDYEQNFPRRNSPDGLKWHPTTEALQNLAQLCGFGSITAENAEEVFIRINMMEQVIGPLQYETIQNAPGEVFVSFDQVVKHIGLKTNANKQTITQFHKTLTDKLRRDATEILEADKQRLPRSA